MPNHFHFLLKQENEVGISKYLSDFQNSYTRYFNINHNRTGPLFMDQFKAVRIESEQQLIHVSRYIHLNPYSGFLTKNLTELENYPWSSFKNYLLQENLAEYKIILDLFSSKDKYKSFVLDQADYQRKLKRIEHLTLE